MKASQPKLVLLLFVFTFMTIATLDGFVDPQGNDLFHKDGGGSNEQQVQIYEHNLIDDNSIDGPEAAVNRGAYGVHPIIQEEFNTAYSPAWNTTGSSGLITFSQTGGYVQATTASTTGVDGYFYFSSALTPSIRRARLQVNWSSSSPDPADSIRWQYYPGVGVNWVDCSGLGADGSDDIDPGLYNFSIQATAGYETNVRFRLYLQNFARSGANPIVRIYSVDVMVYEASLSDTASAGAPYPIYTNLTTPIVVSLSVTRAGSSTLCGLDNTANNYDLVYRRDNSDVQGGGTVMNPTTDNFNGDLASFTYSIPQISTNHSL